MLSRLRLDRALHLTERSGGILNPETSHRGQIQYLSGREAARAAVTANRRMETEEGMIVFPSSPAERSTGAGRCLAEERLPEFCPATPEEAYLMTRAACRYADTYRTAILVRLSPEVAEGRMGIRTEKPGSTERRRRAYVRERGRAAYCRPEEYCENRKYPSEEALLRGRQGREKAGAQKGASGYGTALPQRVFSDSEWNRSSGSGSRGIVVRGAAYLRVCEILNGYTELRILKLGTVWPVPEERILEFMKKIRSLLVLDETRTELLTHIYAIKGKYDLRCEITEFHGEERRADDIAGALRGLLGEKKCGDGEALRRLLSGGAPVERSFAGLPVLP